MANKEDCVNRNWIFAVTIPHIRKFS